MEGQQQRQPKPRQNQNQHSTPKLRGSDRDAPDVRISKSLSWLLRHGAKTAGLQLRADGYAKISDVLANPLFKDVTFVKIQELVSKDLKKRYSLILEPQIPDAPYPSDVWWIRANQGHSIKDVKLDLKPILSDSEIPMAIHGTTRKAWESISTQGLSKMNRNHIHLARGIARDSVISGMRSSSQILIFIDVQKALDAGTTFFLSENGVILTEGDAAGFLAPIFFRRVENANRSPVPGWEGIASDAITTTTTEPAESTMSVQHSPTEQPLSAVEESHS